MRLGIAIGSVTALMIFLSAACARTAHDHQTVSSAESGQTRALMAAARSARESFAKGGAPSVDALLKQFVQALSNSDGNALTALLVSRQEYVDLIVPGTVPVGRDPRQVSDQPKEFFWKMLDTKDHYYQESLLNQFGGRPYRDYTLKLTQGTREYAWYKAHGRVKLDLRGEDDTPYYLSTGWIAEVDGKYKFIGYEADD